MKDMLWFQTPQINYKFTEQELFSRSSQLFVLKLGDFYEWEFKVETVKGFCKHAGLSLPLSSLGNLEDFFSWYILKSCHSKIRSIYWKKKYKVVFLLILFLQKIYIYFSLWNNFNLFKSRKNTQRISLCSSADFPKCSP